MPDDVGFATKPALAKAMLVRAMDARDPALWVAGDEVYGADPGLRAELEARQAGYVWLSAVTAASPPPPGRCVPTHSPPAAQAGLAEALGRPGAKGHRRYDWALACIHRSAGRPISRPAGLLVAARAAAPPQR